MTQGTLNTRPALWLLLLVVSLAGACAAEGPPALAGGPHSVKGTVASSKTGQGVPNILVALLRDGRIVGSMPTSELGEFEFRGLAAGQYVVGLTGVELSGLSPLHTTFTPAEQTVQVGEGLLDLTFAVVGLLPARIVGEVRCDGLPVVGARVHVVGGSTDAVVETDDVGRYGATDLTPGHYTIMAIDVPCEVVQRIEVVSLNAAQSVTVNFEGS